jgi:GntR family transcriptional regulator
MYDLPLDDSLYYDSMYDVFEQVGMGMPMVVNENFQAMLADERLSKALEVKKGSAIFKRIRTAYDENNKPIEYTISYYRGDRYSYSIELRNRK